MRKINLENYVIHGTQGSKVTDIPYQVRDSLVLVLMHPDIKLNAVELLKRDIIGKKILECKEKEILLEESDWLKIKSAVESINGFTQNDVEFVRRVLEAPEVNVREVN